MSTAIKSIDIAETAERARNGEHLLLHDISWQDYDAIGRALEDSHIRLHFDRGSLEIMTVSREHEVYKSLLGRLYEIWAMEMMIPVSYGGSMTLRMENAKRGLELDESYWSRNEPSIRGKLNLDFSVDPPPDLVIEAEVSRTVLNRLDSLAALKVPEVWRFDGNQIWVGLLQPNGQYLWGTASLQFPDFPFREIIRFLRMARTMDHLSVLRAFQQWLRQNPGIKA